MGLWNTDKTKIWLHGAEAKTIIRNMRVIRKKGLYGRNIKSE